MPFSGRALGHIHDNSVTFGGTQALLLCFLGGGMRIDRLGGAKGKRVVNAAMHTGCEHGPA